MDCESRGPVSICTSIIAKPGQQNPIYFLVQPSMVADILAIVILELKDIETVGFIMLNPIYQRIGFGSWLVELGVLGKAS